MEYSEDWKEKEEVFLEEEFKHITDVYESQYDDDEEKLQDVAKFLPVYKEILADIRTMIRFPDIQHHFGQAMHHHILKRNFMISLEIIEAYRILKDQDKPNDDELKKANVLAWCYEIVVNTLLAEDDVINDINERDGRPSWPVKSGLGILGLNDIAFVQTGIFIVLKKHFTGHPDYKNILTTFNEALFYARTGNIMETIPSVMELDLEKCNEEYYTECKRYKISASSTLGMKLLCILVGIKDEKILEKIQAISNKGGYMMQMVKEVNDVYGNKAEGKTIREGKFTWLLLKALEKANEQQKKVLKDCYGKNDPDMIASVKEIFSELSLQQEFKNKKQQLKKEVLSDMLKVEYPGFKKLVVLLDNMMDMFQTMLC
jgi:farnesyl diphosphate synthase